MQVRRLHAHLVEEGGQDFEGGQLLREGLSKQKKFTSFTRQSELDVLRHYLHVVQNAKTEVKKVNFFLFLWVHFTLFIFSNQLKKHAYSQP